MLTTQTIGEKLMQHKCENAAAKSLLNEQADHVFIKRIHKAIESNNMELVKEAVSAWSLRKKEIALIKYDYANNY